MSTIRVNNMTNVGGAGPTYAKGMIIQTVTFSTSTSVSSSTSAYSDTGLTATITPKSASSNILIVVNQNGMNKTSGQTYIGLRLLRGSTVLTQFESYAGAIITNVAESNVGGSGITYLDSPATTGAVTYKTMFNSGAGLATVSVQYTGGTTASSMTLMEIAG